MKRTWRLCSHGWPHSEARATRWGPSSRCPPLGVYTAAEESPVPVSLALHLCCEALHLERVLCWYIFTVCRGLKDCLYEGGVIKCIIFRSINSGSIFLGGGQRNPFSHEAILRSRLNVEDSIFGVYV